MKRSLVFIVLMTFVFLSCEEKEPILTEDTVQNTPLFSDDRQWAVIQDPYLNLLKEPVLTAKAVTTMRQGDVAEIVEVRLVDSEAWCLLEIDGKQGWVAENVLGVYRRKAQAETASRMLLESKNQQ